MENSNASAPAKIEKVLNADFRAPYYSASDGAYKMYDAAVASGDATLVALALKLMQASDAIYSHLDNNYLWD